MDPQEYNNLARVETHHWYYSGKRQLVRALIKRYHCQGLEFLDCGAGTGIFAREMQDAFNVTVLDDHDESIRLLEQHFTAAKVLRVSGTGVPVAPESFDLVTALDVLEHIENDAAAVGEFHRILRPNSTLVITVPASMSLWSDWDLSLHHFRRYSKQDLLRLFTADKWDVKRCNYTNSIPFPLVWFMRRSRSKQAGLKAATNRTEDKIPIAPINWLLRKLFVLQGLCPLPFPFGVSLVLVAKRR